MGTEGSPPVLIDDSYTGCYTGLLWFVDWMASWFV